MKFGDNLHVTKKSDINLIAAIHWNICNNIGILAIFLEYRQYGDISISSKP